MDDEKKKVIFGFFEVDENSIFSVEYISYSLFHAPFRNEVMLLCSWQVVLDTRRFY